jgi:hypothetical protein
MPIILVFWLVVIFLSFSLFARTNATVISALIVSALALSAAIFLIFELAQPFGGLIQISSEPDVPVEQAAQVRTTWIGSAKIGSEEDRKASDSRVFSRVRLTTGQEDNTADARRDTRKVAAHRADSSFGGHVTR